MANLSIVPAAANKLAATTNITSVLPNGANGIIPAFNLLGDTFPSNLNLPCIVLKDGGTYGQARDLPFTQQTLMVMVYDTAPSPNHISYSRIDQLVWECIAALDRATLVMEASYYSLFSIEYDNYISGDLFDTNFRLPYKAVRFRAFMATHTRN